MEEVSLWEISTRRTFQTASIASDVSILKRFVETGAASVKAAIAPTVAFGQKTG
ncbi:MAG: hypothetical protein K6U74_20840 [Firmicutes bacterium]|nr:hypothetical protein [Bacillota bacterium]